MAAEKGVEEAASRLGEEDRDPCVYASQLVTSLTLPMVLNAAMQLQVFEILAKAGPGARLSAVQIVSRMTERVTNQDAASMLDRMLRLLVGHSVLICTTLVDGEDEIVHYGLAPVAKYFVADANGASFVPQMALVQDKVFVASWFELKNVVVEGGVPFDRVHRMNMFEYPGTDPKVNEVLNKAMIEQTSIVIREVLVRYKGFEKLNKLVDVGGGLGVALNCITSKYSSIKGINFDLPHVLANAPSYPGVEHVGGDMFKSVPEGDAIFMKWILHDWSDSHCLKLLENCYKALPEQGKVIVVESVLPIVPETSTSFISKIQYDMIMMAQTPGGKERTQNEFMALATRAGFRGITLCVEVCNFWVMEFFK